MDLTSKLLNSAASTGGSLSRSSLGKAALSVGAKGKPTGRVLKKLEAAAKTDTDIRHAVRALKGGHAARETVVRGLEKAGELGLIHKNVAGAYDKAVSSVAQGKFKPAEKLVTTKSATPASSLLSKGSRVSAKLSGLPYQDQTHRASVIKQVDAQIAALEKSNDTSATVKGQLAFLKKQREDQLKTVAEADALAARQANARRQAIATMNVARSGTRDAKAAAAKEAAQPKRSLGYKSMATEKDEGKATPAVPGKRPSTSGSPGTRLMASSLPRRAMPTRRSMDVPAAPPEPATEVPNDVPDDSGADKAKQEPSDDLPSSKAADDMNIG